MINLPLEHSGQVLTNSHHIKLDQEMALGAIENLNGRSLKYKQKNLRRHRRRLHMVDSQHPTSKSCHATKNKLQITEYSKDRDSLTTITQQNTLKPKEVISNKLYGFKRRLKTIDHSTSLSRNHCPSSLSIEVQSKTKSSKYLKKTKVKVLTQTSNNKLPKKKEGMIPILRCELGCKAMSRVLRSLERLR